MLANGWQAVVRGKRRRMDIPAFEQAGELKFYISERCVQLPYHYLLCRVLNHRGELLQPVERMMDAGYDLTLLGPGRPPRRRRLCRDGQLADAAGIDVWGFSR